jgi:DNA-binding FadR family transcriptional regulator
MPAAELHKETEMERIERWRTEMLERAGFGADAAAELAARFDVDLHQAIGLIESGCDPAVALRILL